MTQANYGIISSGRWLAIVCAAFVSQQALANMSLQECEKLAIHADESTSLGSPADRARELARVGRACVGRGSYDTRLASLLLDSGELSEAARVATNGINAGSQQQPNLMQVLAEVARRSGDTAGAHDQALKIAEKFPRYTPILGFLAAEETAAKHWDKVLQLFEKIYSIEPSALALLGQAGALHQLDRHEECVAAVYRALEMEPSRVAKRTGVLEAVFSLGILKRDNEARNLVKRHMAANPNWAQDTSMANAARALGLVK